MKRGILKSIYKDARGSAIIMVLVGMAFVITLVTTMYSVTIANVNMKHNDVRIKRNFYSAEMVTEQMKAGLEDLASEAYSDAYRKAYSNRINTKTVDDSVQITSSVVSSDTIQTYYLSTLLERLQKSPSDQEHYDVEKLKGMVDLDLLGSETNDSNGLDLTQLRTYYDNKSRTAAHVLEKKSDKLILRDVYVRYTNPEDGAVSEIRTDFTLKAPTIGDDVAIPNLFDYSIIARRTMEVKAGAEVASNKSIYAGDEGFVISDGSQGASLSMAAGKYLVSKGAVSLQGLANGTAPAKLSTGQNSSFYVRDIDLDNAEVTVRGLAAVADDTVYSGAGTLKVDGGRYIGFGDSESDEAKSSAILINHPYAVLDAGNANRFVLAGRAFIGQNTGSAKFGETSKSKMDAEEEYEALEVSGLSNADSSVSAQTGATTETIGGSDVQVSGVPISRSIAVKVDQAAYLVPPECLGVRITKVTTGSEGSETTEDFAEVLVGLNPVPDVTMNTDGSLSPKFSLGDYSDWQTDPNFKIVDMDTPVESLGNKNLSYYADNDRYSVRYVQGQYGQNMAYFYVYVKEDKQQEFLNTAYGRSLQTSPYALGEDSSGEYTEDQLKRQKREGQYFTFYTSDRTGTGNVTLPLNTQIKGTYVAKDSSSGNLISYPEGSFKDPALHGRYQGYYQALYARLVETLDSSDYLNHTIFQNLIDEGTLNAVLNAYDYDDNSANGREVRFSVGSDYYGILTDTPYVYTGEGDQNKIRVIISSSDNDTDEADVTVKSDFTGFIISDGKITLDGDFSLNSIPIDVAKVMISKTVLKKDAESQEVNDGHSIIDCFKDKEELKKQIDTDPESLGEEEEKVKDVMTYSTMVHYENFQKK